ncbi:MAG: hypothetical protein ACJA13_002728 [Paraglaciecola sp.]|jgi:hypothetical protein
MKDIFFFDSMLTPKIITFIYWLMLFAALVSGLGEIFSGYGGFFGNLFSGLAIIMGGAIAARIWCELMIVLFKIHENLQKIAERNDLSTGEGSPGETLKD